MLKKDEMYVRDAQLFTRHPGLQTRMRSILLDWLIEVGEVYRLHRETFYLAADFIDRYLTKTNNVQKQQLQLIGVTALFVAAKLEEIYPPKLSEFAYVTDGACTDEEILEQELLLLKELNWDLAPITVSSWLNIYMQLANTDNLEDTADNFVFPKYSVHEYIQISRLLDLCILDIDYLQFPYSIMSAAAFYHMSSTEHALATLGLQWADVAPCIQWMAPFAMALRELGPVELKFFSQVSTESTHNIQTHVVDLGLLEKVQARQTQMQLSTARSSPELSSQFPGIITPPQSIKRCTKPCTEDISNCETTP
jgi:cyclin E